jgi:dTDP-4-dehydrorhamnose reductase
MDLTDQPAVRAAVSTVDTVINTAYRYEDWGPTADGAAYVAVACAEFGARLVHLSSDAIHSGRKAPYMDDDPPTPVTPYGAAKAAAETAVRAVHPSAAVLRTSLILGDEHSKQVKLCLDLLTGRTAGALFSDEYRCPVDVGDLAAAVLEVAGSGYAGRLNVAGAQALSRVELGALVAGRYGLDATRVPATTLAEAGVVRPAEVRLDITRATTLLATRLRPASEVLAPRGRA